MDLPQKLAWLALAGSLGTLARYGLGEMAQKACGTGFPWGTLTVNLLGCLLFGFVWTLADGRSLIREETRFLILTGFMGAFTTFSTFAFETGGFLRNSDWGLAAANIALQNGLGILALLLGITLGRWL